MPIYTMNQRETFAFSAENPTGARNGGTRGSDCEKLRPCIDIQPERQPPSVTPRVPA